MKKWWMILGLGPLFVASVVLAAPPNLNWTKKELLLYQSSGSYLTDIKLVVHSARRYLKRRIASKQPGQKLAIMVDVDETALSNFKQIRTLLSMVGDVGDVLPKNKMAVLNDNFHDPAIKPTLRLYQYALKHGVAVFLVTGRYHSDLAGTIKNLKAVGYDHWQKLILRTPAQHDLSANLYKRDVAQAIRKQGYDLVLAIGDQYSDLPHRYIDEAFKLPNPYYFTP